MNEDKIIAVVLRLIKANGRLLTLQTLDATATDPTKPWRGRGTPTVLSSIEVPGVFVPASGSDLGSELVSPALLARADEVLLLAPAAIDLSLMNMAVDLGVTWMIEWVKVLRPQNKILLYAMGVKR